MASVRRSTRLSSIGLRGAATPTSAAATQTATTTGGDVNGGTPRRAEIWRHRQTKNSALRAASDSAASDSDDDDAASAEKNENLNTLNKMDAIGEARSAKRSTATKKPPKKPGGEEAPATPRRSHKVAAATRPMPASKKREAAAAKRKSVLQAPASDSGSDGEEHKASVGEVEVSPPKQPRRHASKALPEELISPSRLLDRLSIDERPRLDPEATAKEEEDQSTEEPCTKASPRRNKYQNARRVLNSAETKNLPGREEQLQQLRSFFQEHLDGHKSGSLYVSGQPGTGKTACLGLLLRTPEFSRRLQCVYINCTSIASVGGVYKKLCSELQITPPGRTERDHLAAIQRHLRSSSRFVLMVLDEIDQLCSSKQSVLYTIFEWPALPGARLLLVGIANSLDLTDRALIRLNARCELKPQLMHFPPYSKPQIVEIFRSRLEEAGVLEVFPPVTLQLLAAKVSAMSGDVRRALDIGRRVVEIAEQQMRAGKKEVDLQALKDLKEGGEEAAKPTVEAEEAPLKPVMVTQVVDVLNKVYAASQNLQDDIEESFPLQQKLVLCSLMMMLRHERHKDISMGRLHEVYRRVCSKRNIVALDQAEFAGLVSLVETRGILRIVRKKEPRLSKVQLQWDEDEVRGALADKQLIASILDDTSCLGHM